MKRAILCLLLAILFLVGCTGEAVFRPMDETPAATEGEPAVTETPTPSPEPLSTITMLAADGFKQPALNFDIYEQKRDIMGLYMTSNTAGLRSALDRCLDVVEQTELNAVVIDVKRDDGFIPFPGKIEVADEYDIIGYQIKDIDGLLAELKAKNIYTIARIVTFKDKAIVEHRPDFLIPLQDGSLYKEGELYWLNPFNKEVWDYVLDIAEDAAKLGFDEIQFDYVRFPTDKNIRRAVFDNPEGKEFTDVIAEFGEYAVSRLKPYGVKVSADVYAISIVSDYDASLIGQDYVRLSQIFDVICPMAYPSHYANGTFNIPYPDLDPYGIVYNTMIVSTEKLQKVKDEGGKVATVRPWIQSFTASYLKVNYQEYGPKQIVEQINACVDAGVMEYLLWSGPNKYPIYER